MTHLIEDTEFKNIKFENDVCNGCQGHNGVCPGCGDTCEGACEGACDGSCSGWHFAD